MFRLTREVRFAVNATPDRQLQDKPANSHGGYPSTTGFSPFLTVRVTLRGELNPQSSYLVNIKDVDGTVREYLPDITQLIRDGGTPAEAVLFLHSMCYERWREQFESVELLLTPFLALAAHRQELPMVRLSQKFEFSASHRLFNADLSNDENCRIYGKCSNPNGHGHNYELQVTLAGERDRVEGVLKNLPDFERIVSATVIDRLDHKNLNLDVPEFADVTPSVENIARIIYKLLAPKFGDAGARLAAVTVWETPKTWCEYSE